MANEAPKRDDEVRGVLFINERKAQDNHPDRTGEITIHGKKWKLSGWLKTPANGGKQFLSIKVSEFLEPKKYDAPQNDAREDF